MECSLLMAFMKRTMLHKGCDWSFREVWRLLWNITQIFLCCTVKIRCDTCKIIHSLQNPSLPVPENAGTLVRCYEYFIESQQYFIQIWQYFMEIWRAFYLKPDMFNLNSDRYFIWNVTVFVFIEIWQVFHWNLAGISFKSDWNVTGFIDIWQVFHWNLASVSLKLDVCFAEMWLVSLKYDRHFIEIWLVFHWNVMGFIEIWQVFFWNPTSVSVKCDWFDWNLNWQTWLMVSAVLFIPLGKHSNSRTSNKSEERELKKKWLCQFFLEKWKGLCSKGNFF